MKESTALDCVKLFSSDLFRSPELQLLRTSKEVPRSGVGRCESGVFLPSLSGLWEPFQPNPVTKLRCPVSAARALGLKSMQKC